MKEQNEIKLITITVTTMLLLLSPLFIISNILRLMGAMFNKLSAYSLLPLLFVTDNALKDLKGMKKFNDLDKKFKFDDNLDEK